MASPSREPLDLEAIRIDSVLALRVPESLALRRRVVVFGRDGESAYAACADPEDLAAIESVERIVGSPVVALAAEPASLERALSRLYGRRDAAPVDEAVRLVEEVLRAALVEQASDVHLAPVPDGLRVRFRVDGVLETRRELPPATAPAFVNRVKVLAGMDIAEKRLPQDGRFTWTPGGAGATALSPHGETPVDVRVASMPTRHGERMTLRLLASRTGSLTLPRLGLAPRDLGTFRSALGHAHGLVLLTGPTGSGKTTTLYAAIRELDLETQHVLTIEDPVEYELPGVSQVEVDSGDRVTFSRALRSVLRHDPDVLMVGEVRDQETADVTVKASLTGHLVLSTLHTNNAVSAVTRLVDIGVPPYLVAATLRLAVAQRLVRRLCERCRRPRPLASAEARALGVPTSEGHSVFEAAGCVYCRQSGFVGRIGVFELFAVDPEIAAAVAGGAHEAQLRAMAAERGATGLRADAAAKVLAGATTADEALAVLEEGR
ncbi:MAG TPA: GspE/PulE family protein [Planctomycetota bacterium]|nr:GspE/PulE family protein [Planctomycetota bacterium]